MANACVTWAYTPVAEGIDVLGLVPYQLAEGQSCPADGMVVLGSTEYADLQAKAANNLLSLSYADGTVLSLAVAAVWLVAWTWKVMNRTLDVADAD